MRPPEPQLLDTCVIQNLDWVDRQIEARGSVVWDEAATARLADKYGAELAHDLIALGVLYKRFEYYSGYPWLICNAAVDEAGLLRGSRGERLRQLLTFLADHQGDWTNDAYPETAQGLLVASQPPRVSPLILHGLGVTSVEDVYADDGPLDFLPDRGDRLITAHALFANIPVILTTDRRSFWARRDQLTDLGVGVFRPVELLVLYEPYWDALEPEFGRRRGTP